MCIHRSSYKNTKKIVIGSTIMAVIAEIEPPISTTIFYRLRAQNKNKESQMIIAALRHRGRGEKP